MSTTHRAAQLSAIALALALALLGVGLCGEVAQPPSLPAPAIQPFLPETAVARPLSISNPADVAAAAELGAAAFRSVSALPAAAAAGAIQPLAAMPANASGVGRMLHAAENPSWAAVAAAASARDGAASADLGASRRHWSQVFDLAGNARDGDGSDAPPGSGDGASAPSNPGGNDNKSYPAQAPILEHPEPVFPGLTGALPPAMADRPGVRELAAREAFVVAVTPPRTEDLDKTLTHARTGTLARLKLIEPEPGMKIVLIEALREARLTGPVQDGIATVTYPKLEREPEIEAMHIDEIHSLSHVLGEQGKYAAVYQIVHNAPNFETIANALVSALPMPVETQKTLLDANSIPIRLSAVVGYLREAAKEAAPPSTSGGRQGMNPMEMMRRMMGGGMGMGGDQQEEEDPELVKIKQKYAEKKDKMTEEARKEAEREFGRLARMNPMAAEYGVAIDFLSLLTDLPWGTGTVDNNDLQYAKKVLDDDHYGLEEVKERIIEYLTIRKVTGNSKGLILAFDGPPGVGKTSLGRSIARALGRKFYRLALGAVHDEAELRGHRRTYIGAQPGKLIEIARRLGVNNFVLQLDEVDKLGADFKGDPQAALMEILDPEQNFDFRDAYLNVGFDLSNVLFLVTSNELENIKGPLRDRLDVIRISGYTEDEKVKIAQMKLIDRQLQENGFKPGDVRFKEAALRSGIRGYTREAGVRNLERMIAAILRRLQTRIAGVTEGPVVKDVGPEHLPDLLKKAPKEERRDLPNANDVGVASGLYWSPMGGGVLLIETKALPKGTAEGTMFTGNIQNVMTESEKVARQNAVDWALKRGVSAKAIAGYDISLHVPEGAIPKDGPSAGIAIFTALASRYSGRPVRKALAMTGELTLTGKVWGIGGLKEKSLGAIQQGYKEIILSEDNRSDYEELPKEIKDKLKIHFVTTAAQVAEIALAPGPGNPLKEIPSVAPSASQAPGEGWLRRLVRWIWG